MKKLIVVLLLCCLVTQAGCWDRREINELGFVLAVGIDEIQNDEEKKRSEHIKKFSSTWQIAVPGNMTGSDGGNGQAFFNVTSSDFTSFKTGRNIAHKNSRKLFYEHLKTIIISENLVRDGMIEHILDFYTRDHEMRRNMRVLISEGLAREIISINVPLEDIPAIFIDSIRGVNSDYSFSILEQRELGEISSLIMGNHSYLLTRITKGDGDEIKVGGAAIFLGDTNEMIDWLGEEEIIGYNLIMGESNNGVLEVPYEEDGLFVFESDRIDTNVDFVRKNGKNSFKIKIKAEGMFGESWIHDEDINDEKMIEKLEDAVEKEIERQARNTMEKMQTEYYADVFNLWREAEINNYTYWKSVKDNWDGEAGEFAKSEVIINAEIEIRHYMINESLE